MRTFYICDMHIGHKNVLHMDKRPFNTIEEMDETIKRNWNSRVTKDDRVIVVGDVFYRIKDKEYMAEYLNSLNGELYLVKGNHDKILVDYFDARKMFKSVSDLLDIKDKSKTFGDVDIQACHYPLTEWRGFYHGSWLIYGHIHNNTDQTFDFMKHFDRALNAGCMINGYMPVTFDELVENNKRFKEQNWNKIELKERKWYTK